MLRIPIPVALAVLIVAGAATVYFYVTVIQNPVQGAWSDQGDTTTYTYTVPAGGWVILGAFGGSAIYIQSNATIDIRGHEIAVQAWTNDYMPEGKYQLGPGGCYWITVTSGGVSLDACYKCEPASTVRLSNGMIMYYPNYTAVGADCSCMWPPSQYTIDSDGYISAGSCTYGSDINVKGVTSYTLIPTVYNAQYGMGSKVYYLYLRPVYAIWVKPYANASITVTVKP